jgi:hypothetical protein
MPTPLEHATSNAPLQALFVTVEPRSKSACDRPLGDRYRRIGRG